MGISTQQLIESLSSHSILPKQEVTTIRDGLTDAELGVDAETLVRDLVRTGKITKFQAVNLYQGRGKGLVFGEYVVLDKIGSGGMGKVYKARHREEDRLVALKVLLPHAVSSPKAVQAVLSRSRGRLSLVASERRQRRTVPAKRTARTIWRWSSSTDRTFRRTSISTVR